MAEALSFASTLNLDELDEEEFIDFMDMYGFNIEQR